MRPLSANTDSWNLYGGQERILRTGRVNAIIDMVQFALETELFITYIPSNGQFAISAAPKIADEACPVRIWTYEYNLIYDAIPNSVAYIQSRILDDLHYNYLRAWNVLSRRLRELDAECLIFNSVVLEELNAFAEREVAYPPNFHTMNFCSVNTRRLFANLHAHYPSEGDQVLSDLFARNNWSKQAFAQSPA